MSGYGGNINYYLPWYEYDPPWWMKEKPERRRSKWVWRWRHWTKAAKDLPRPKWTPDPNAFPFLNLPRELRNLVYDCAAQYHLPIEYDGPVRLPAPESSGLLSYCGTPP
ncbi:hypothetical protein BDV96DRAFT_371463 [Lophiotrema nucula]|uniref:Uncharacterized protein n=1 Tax=Lophiotrema nucula TaxID=690887 RepID=A0A6A5ZI74_9PLEO|nr:hypothetical protein BDV96DRAFT_371463 [Lophiotrema nucula]